MHTTPAHRAAAEPARLSRGADAMAEDDLINAVHVLVRHLQADNAAMAASCAGQGPANPVEASVTSLARWLDEPMSAYLADYRAHRPARNTFAAECYREWAQLDADDMEAALEARDDNPFGDDDCWWDWTDVETEQPGDEEQERGGGRDHGPGHPAGPHVLGYGLHPQRFPGIVTVCRSCLATPDRERFEQAYDSDALGEITGWTVNDEDPVFCDVCLAQIHPGIASPDSHL